MKKIAALTITLLLITLTGCSKGKPVFASENYITKKVAVEPFSGINVFGSADVIYTTGETQAVEVYGADNIISLLDLSVEDGVLMAQFKKNTYVFKRGKLVIRVTSPELSSLSINGSGNISFREGVKSSNNLKLTINGSGDIKASSVACKDLSISISGSGSVILKDINSEDCQAQIAGSGDISLTGSAQTATYSIAGSGNIDAANLKAASVSSSTSGSGSIRCYASNRLKARINGSGDIAYKGDPQDIDFPRKGLHKID